MIYDSHVHLSETGDHQEAMAAALLAADVKGLMLFSNPPPTVSAGMVQLEPGNRLKRLMHWAGHPALAGFRIWPFYFLDPLDADIYEQIDAAAASGAAGLKCICTWFYPDDEKPMQVWRYLAERNLPVKFHSGIIYAACNGRTDTSKYNRPIHFEALLGIPRLRFTLSHVAWPWCDECLALYGKACSMLKYGLSSARMFIDTTPGTPVVYREEVLRRLYTIGYDIDSSLVFGSDNREAYNPAHVKRIEADDRAIFSRLGLTAEQKKKYFCDNMVSFVEG